MLPAPVFLAEASGIGHTYIEPDADGVVRTNLAAVRVGASLVPSLSAVITSRALGISPNEMIFHSNNALTMGTRQTPLDSTQHSRPRYFPPSGVQAFQQYPYWQVLSGGVPKGELRDKVVLIGLMNNDSADDSVTTPVSKATPPVVAIASAVSSSLAAQMYSRPAYAPVVEWGVVVLVLLFSAFMLPAAGCRDRRNDHAAIHGAARRLRDHAAALIAGLAALCPSLHGAGRGLWFVSGRRADPSRQHQDQRRRARSRCESALARADVPQAEANSISRSRPISAVRWMHRQWNCSTTWGWTSSAARSFPKRRRCTPISPRAILTTAS